jgi:hypothetical protein
MSWRLVSCSQLWRPRNPEPHSTPSLHASRSRDPLVRRDVELASVKTDVASPSCPRRRTSSAPQSTNRGQHKLDLKGFLSTLLRPLRLYDVLLFLRGLHSFRALLRLPSLRHLLKQSYYIGYALFIPAPRHVRYHQRHVGSRTLGSGVERLFLGLDVCRRWNVGLGAQHIPAAKFTRLEL